MSRLDSLLAMVDTINTKADTLVNSFSESNNLISLIVDINSSIAGSDTEIDHISNLIQKNSSYLSEFQTLYEKSFFLESNLDLQGSFINESTYSSIYNQYYNLWNLFEIENRQHPPESPEPEMVEPQAPLKNMLSISNLNLKPLKCKSTKVSKQKSRYRLSEAYTLNPVSNQHRDVSEGSTYTNASNIMECDTSKNTESASISSYSDGELDDWDRELNSYSTSKIHKSIDIKSKPDDIFQAPFYDISHSPLSLKTKRLSADVCDLDDPEPDPEPVTVVQEDEFANLENFHQFLRKSRIDLREAFPEPKSKPSAAAPPKEPSLSYRFPPAFNNPARMIPSHTKQLSSQPTVEQVYSSSFDRNLKFSEHSKKLLGPQTVPKETSSKVTTPVKKQNYGLFQLLNSPLGSPRLKSNKPIRQLDVAKPSPKVPNSSRDPTARRFSNDFMGISLASTFLSLVGTSTTPTPKDTVPEVLKPSKGKSPPAKIKKLKRNQNDPIAASNEIRSKRLPPTERGNKSSSSGSKDSGHKNDSDLHKQFFVRRTTSLLKDALNESILS